MPSADRRIFFGVSTGRTGTMMLARLLDSEPGAECLHEGNRLDAAGGGVQVLQHLTLQNLVAYHNPSDAFSIMKAKRGEMSAYAEAKGLSFFGDIAYNYAPFVAILPRALPEARLIAVFRDGREFMRSVITTEDPDPTPVGWLERPLSTRVERFIALGRLRPAPHDPLAAEWSRLSAVARNAWLWAETNRLILDGLQSWNPAHLLSLKFEEFMANLPVNYQSLRTFLGIAAPISAATLQLARDPINPRRKRSMPAWPEWRPEEQQDFLRFAGPMMSRLGYEI